MRLPQYFITLHVTRRCTNRCRFCTTDPLGRPPETVPLPALDAFLREHTGRGYEAVCVIGGEPTVYEPLVELLRRIRQYGYPTVIMFTNARRLADADYAKRLVDLGVSFFVISVHGPNAAVHDGLTTVPGSFDEAMQGIDNVKRLGQGVQSATVCVQQNYQDLRAIAGVLSRAGVDTVNLAGLCPAGLAASGLRNLAVPYSELLPVLDETIRYCDEIGQHAVLEGFPFCAVRPHERLCVEWWRTRKERMLFYGQVIDDYDDCLNATGKRLAPPCAGCAARTACGGVYTNYHQLFGHADLEPFSTWPGPAPRIPRASGGLQEQCDVLSNVRA
ncbi:MAG TPA: radical SAM protein [Vicinamibacterales bacterium]|jgi:MoaA/NifB/PqqE/SkfB family radical SAM enzyme